MLPFLDPWNKFPMYGIMIAIGLVLCIILSLFWRETKISRDDAVYATTFAIIGGFVGAKVFSILQNIPSLINGSTTFINLLLSGYVFYGGFIGGIIGIVIYGAIFKINMITLLDFAAVRVPVGQAFGRIGCLCAGCCYGSETTLPWGVVYPESNIYSTVPKGVHLHPTQIYETIYCTLIFVVLMVMTSKHFRGKIKKGVVATTYVGLYAVCRFINEFFRADAERKFVGALSTSQFISIILIVLAIAGWIVAIVIQHKRKSSPKFAEKFVYFMTEMMPKPKAPTTAVATATADGAAVTAGASTDANTAEATADDTPAPATENAASETAPDTPTADTATNETVDTAATATETTANDVAPKETAADTSDETAAAITETTDGDNATATTETATATTAPKKRNTSSAKSSSGARTTKTSTGTAKTASTAKKTSSASAKSNSGTKTTKTSTGTTKSTSSAKSTTAKKSSSAKNTDGGDK